MSLINNGLAGYNLDQSQNSSIFAGEIGEEKNLRGKYGERTTVPIGDEHCRRGSYMETNVERYRSEEGGSKRRRFKG
jgi:hypothetical protein